MTPRVRNSSAVGPKSRSQPVSSMDMALMTGSIGERMTISSALFVGGLRLVVQPLAAAVLDVYFVLSGTCHHTSSHVSRLSVDTPLPPLSDSTKLMRVKNMGLTVQ